MGETRVLIVGAGEAGEELLEELIKHFSRRYKVAGFIDDDPQKKGKNVNGVPLVGTVDDIALKTRELNIREVFIAIPSADGKTIRRVVDECRKEKVIFKIIPRTLEIVEGKVKIHQVRQIRVQDLLGRAILKSDQQQLRKSLKGKRILVTGAAGSIGSELMRQLVQLSPELVFGTDWRESELYFLERELENLQSAGNFQVFICNVQDNGRVKQLIESVRPNIVFHAAAYKHVPVMQDSPTEAVKNNVLGTQNLARVAYDAGVEKFVNVSTDKAVNPSSVMGATKLLTEQLVSQLNNGGKTKYISVRFGNVLDSEGSVIPLFEKQITQGGPVTITDMDMARYFMTIPEAVQLVLQASVLGKGGEVFILDMGERIKIIDLAELMIRLAGFIPEEDIKIKVIGKRAGEKINEELLNEQEQMMKTENKKIYRISVEQLPPNVLNQVVSDLRRAIVSNDDDQVYDALKIVAPNLQDNTIPLTRASIGKEEVEAVTRVLESGWLTMGNETAKFEEMFADYVGAKHAVAVNSCTSGLFLALKALGIGPGDEVIVPSFTFASSVSTIVHAGAMPVFADINREEGFVMTQETFERALTEKTKALIPVHYGGNRAGIETNLPIIEDSAHLIPRKGNNNNAFAVSYSFYATKNMTTGEGGMITVKSKRVYEWLKKARLHGLSKDAWKRYDAKSKWVYTVEFPGYKFNTTDINSALGRVQLTKLRGFERRRVEVVGLYNRLLELNNKGTHLYPILVENRDKFLSYMKENRVGCSFHFTPLHLEPAFKKYTRRKLPVTEYVGRRIVTLPLDAVITDKEVRKVVNLVKLFPGGYIK